MNTDGQRDDTSEDSAAIQVTTCLHRPDTPAVGQCRGKHGRLQPGELESASYPVAIMVPEGATSECGTQQTIWHTPTHFGTDQLCSQDGTIRLQIAPSVDSHSMGWPCSR